MDSQAEIKNSEVLNSNEKILKNLTQNQTELKNIGSNSVSTKQSELQPTKIQHRLSLRLSNSPSSPQIISPRSPNRSLSPHLGIVNKLYEEEMLTNELITTTQVDDSLIEAIHSKLSSNSNLSKQCYSPSRSPDLRKN